MLTIAIDFDDVEEECGGERGVLREHLDRRQSRLHWSGWHTVHR